MKIYRYSNDGFKPQFQEHHYKQILLSIDDKWFEEEYLLNCPEHLKRISVERHEREKEFYGENLQDFKYGIWVFTSMKHKRRSLNHLDIIPQLWQAEIPDNITAYDVDFQHKYSLSNCPGASLVGCYIPERELDNITNIKKLNNKYEGKLYEDYYKRR